MYQLEEEEEKKIVIQCTLDDGILHCVIINSVEIVSHLKKLEEKKRKNCFCKL